jgi:hypothetical protein
MSAGSGPIRVAKKIITDTIHTTIIPKRKRLMMYLFTSLYSAGLFPTFPMLIFQVPEDAGGKALPAESARQPFGSPA